MTQHTAQPAEAQRSARPSWRRAARLSPALALVLGFGTSSGHAATATPCTVGFKYTSNITCGINVDGVAGIDLVLNLSTTSTTPYAFFGALGTTTLLEVGPTAINNLKRLAAGDIVDSNAFATGTQGTVGYVYGANADQWASDGDTGYAGFRISSIVNGQTVYNYGYIGLTRGSLTITGFGYQTTAGLAAQIPAATVPEPTSLGLVAAAAGGLLAARRRRSGAKTAR